MIRRAWRYHWAGVRARRAARAADDAALVEFWTVEIHEAG